jgi:hypothetical protein
MKRVIFILSLLFLTKFIYSQTEKGRLLIGGNLNGYGYFSKTYPFSVSLNPNIGIFVKKNFAVGLKTQFGATFSHLSNGFTMSASPFFRYYFPSTNPLRFFITADVGYYYNHINDKNFIPKYSFSSDGFIMGAAPGLAYFINENVALETMLRYEFTANRKYFSNVSNDNSRYYLLIGFQIYFNRKKASNLIKS